MTTLAQGIGYGRGSSGEPVRELQRYLARFGYLAAEAGDPYRRMRAGKRALRPAAGEFDSATVGALRRFQRHFRLPVTGVLDEATVGLMTRPRCGFPDLPANFVAPGNRWDHTNLTYHVDDYTSDLSKEDVDAALTAAMSLWSAVTPLTFTDSPNPDIRIRFVSGDHGDGSPFDGVGNVLAHAFFPPPPDVDLAGDVHFDDAETWSLALPVPTGDTDLITVAAHELGHALGLGHSDDPAALMWPFYAGAHRYLGVDDVRGMQSVYGSSLHEVPGWFGAEDQGASVAIGAIADPQHNDLVVFHVDNPDGENHGYYRIGWNLDAAGNATGGWSDVKAVPGWFGAEDQGAGVAIGDVNGSGRPDLLVFHVDNPDGENFGYYRIGWDLDAAGNVTGGWSDIKPVPGWFGWEDEGAACTLADLTGNGRPDLLVFHIDNPDGENVGYYRTGWDLDAAGNVTGGWSDIKPVPGWFGWEDQGGGIAVADVAHDGGLDLVVFHIDNPDGENHGYYRIGWNLDAAGNVTGGWSDIKAVRGWFGAEDQGAGIATADLNRNGRTDLVVFHVDNPDGENHGFYRVLTDL
ncbi:matrixin family metalloprotease [Actinoplanes sp. KI2]|uniref:matrixin family metalloprotease n=1 Tax=Actinoplanes sp. KI2 TaxID=2983315 RepID=UPI0021D5E036|nr:matrixin family metalloprotease [Actinoplanes sp. KI2]MCU7725230.1 matrixin family metalloprotease [Actinoplanes sp. KI2]